MLQHDAEQIALKNWAQQILDSMQPICSILDADNPERPYTQALALQQTLVDNPDLTPSARILADMRQTEQCFGSYALNKSATHQQYFKQQPLSAAQTEEFNTLAAASLLKQQQLEINDTLSFDAFLSHYFAQH
jgi:glutamate--cysteine ligase